MREEMRKKKEKQKRGKKQHYTTVFGIGDASVINSQA
jgi:hypothetical protein